MAEAEAVLVGDDDSPFGSSQGVTIEKVTSEFGDTSAFALQVSIWALVQYFPPQMGCSFPKYNSQEVS